MSSTVVDYMTAHDSSPHIAVVQKQECKGIEHLEETFQDIIAFGGEGVILRDPSTPLQPGRSSGYLKHKVTHPLIFKYRK